MNKALFIEQVQKCGEYKTKKEAEVAVASFIAAVEVALMKGDSVELVGFGKFESALQKGKEGKIPGKNETYKTSDKMTPKFKAGKALKDKVAKLKLRKK